MWKVHIDVVMRMGIECDVGDMKEVERKVLIMTPPRNREPVAYVNIPAEVKKFYCVEKDGKWVSLQAKVFYDEDTGVMVVMPKKQQMTQVKMTQVNKKIVF